MAFLCNVAAKRDDTCLASRRATYGPYRPPLDKPFRWAKNGLSQMRRPAYNHNQAFFYTVRVSDIVNVYTSTETTILKTFHGRLKETG